MAASKQQLSFVQLFLIISIACLFFGSNLYLSGSLSKKETPDPVSAETKITEQSIRVLLKANPDIVLDVIRDNPLEIQKIVVAGQKKAYEETIANIRNEELKNPKEPVLGKNLKAMPGSAEDAPVTIVVYSSFQCPNCAHVSKTIEQLMEQYPGKLKVYYKHTTGSSNLAFQEALAFEAILRQSPAKAWFLHNYMFENLDAIRADGLSAILPFAQKIKVDMKQLAKDMESPLVLDRLRSDVEENQHLKIQYTPTVIINGISVIGSRPLKEYTDVIDYALEHKGA